MQNSTTPTQKTCRLCNVTKNKDKFTNHGGHKDGLQSNCKSCEKKRMRAVRKRALKKAAQSHPSVPNVPPTQSITPPPTKLTTVTPELVIDIPGIFEIQNRGKNYTSYNFTSPIDGSTFSFPSFKEARQARQASCGQMANPAWRRSRSASGSRIKADFPFTSSGSSASHRDSFRISARTA